MTCAAQFVRRDAHHLLRVAYGKPGRDPGVVFAPPLAEEMNRCRRWSHLLGQQLADAGLSLSKLDFSGTGDSTGLFEDARLSQWARELTAEMQALADCRALIGLRSGALLVPHLDTQQLASAPLLVLLNPVLDGRTFFRQQLRLRVMASKFAGSTESEADLREMLEEKAEIELGGYAFAGDLVDEIESTTVRPEQLSGFAGVALLEVRADGGADLSTPLTRFAEEVRSAGQAVTTQVIAAEQFWATQEIAAPRNVAEAVAATVIATAAAGVTAA